MPSPQNQQPTHLVWLVAVLYCNRNYRQAIDLIASDVIFVNGLAENDVLQVVRSGDTLVWQDRPHPVDLDDLRKANALRLQIEMFLGGPEAAYIQLKSQPPSK